MSQFDSLHHSRRLRACLTAAQGRSPCPRLTAGYLGKIPMSMDCLKVQEAVDLLHRCLEDGEIVITVWSVEAGGSDEGYAMHTVW